MKYGLLGILMMFSTLLLSQDEPPQNSGIFNIGFEYGYQFAGGDLADRFDESNLFGLKTEYLLPNNFSFSLQYNFFYGRNVKDDPLNNLRNEDSLFIGNNFTQANVFLRQRGFYLGSTVGKLFSLSKKNPRSGIKVEVGAGLLQHKIRIQEDPESFVPIVSGDYKKGFDRLTNGLALRQFIGYQYHSLNRLVNFYAGVEFTQGFTQNRRSYNYDVGGPITTSRLDLLTGLKVGWIMSIYTGASGEEIYY